MTVVARKNKTTSTSTSSTYWQNYKTFLVLLTVSLTVLYLRLDSRVYLVPEEKTNNNNKDSGSKVLYE
eukprot:CAMPEP_0194255770 /NCGR_PEP_ID=MMETSP0158-20130606/35294_1 /TAXON_ID=33649 /ORGANISM="Thalassionema nitzschioides, Strain L26-B" /LENGTH=67 /DNA_ID=CAMNT_0038994239 /DNA_START=85 /DNA_END=285 /DNA_ORIENTATION=+